jgi:hypothetical protein
MGFDNNKKIGLENRRAYGQSRNALQFDPTMAPTQMDIRPMEGGIHLQEGQAGVKVEFDSDDEQKENKSEEKPE